MAASSSRTPSPSCTSTSSPGSRLAVFERESDLRRAIDYYLEHDDERRAIARAGLQRSVGYSWPRLLAGLLEKTASTTRPPS